MKLTNSQIERMVKSIFDLWKEKKVVTFKEDERKIFDRACFLIRQEYEREKELDAEANRMVDELERQQPGLERHKLFVGIKKRLAKDKGIVL